MKKVIFLYTLLISLMMTAFICFSEQANAQIFSSDRRFVTSPAASQTWQADGILEKKFHHHIMPRAAQSRRDSNWRSFSEERIVQRNPLANPQRPSSIFEKLHKQHKQCTVSNYPNSLDIQTQQFNDKYTTAQITDLHKELSNKGISDVTADTITESWVRHYPSGLVSDDDNAYAIVIDTSGNIYVTGSSVGPGTSYDYVTIKYNATGTEQWVARYNGPGNSDDGALAIKVDASGNVYVTGYSVGSGTSYDYATIKYSATGAEQWVARYNGPGNSDDGALAIAVDTSGNVYVTGMSTGSSTSEDYATIKYDASGKEQWVARYNGPGNSDDYALFIAVDAPGHVYVTGYSVGSGTSYDYATIKYNASGTELWVARFSGPGSDYDAATALAIDAYGNVYVTGNSNSGTSWDYATIKYNTAGVEQWIAQYNGPGNADDGATAIAVDASGNVYVTGYSSGLGTSEDYATIKYNASGKEQWVARYNGPGNANDGASAITVDASGNVYVTGGSYGSGTSEDYATIKYNASGIEQWVARYKWPDNSGDCANAIVVDASGYVYVTGSSVGLGTSNDYATIKYNASGTELWVARYNGRMNSYNCANAIAVDILGNVYVTGESGDSDTSYDYITIKYNTAGVEQWVARYNGPGNEDDRALAIGVDALGNVYVTGYSYDLVTSYDYTTIKYNPVGAEQWVARYNGPGNAGDGAFAIAVDASGNVYVTGGSYSGTSDDYATIKYNTSGKEQWVARYNGPGNSGDVALAIAIDALGSVYVTGFSTGIGTSYDYATIKYNTAGVEQWVARYNGPGNAEDRATAIAIDVSGNAYVTGGSYGINTQSDYATIKYNASGIEQWVARFNGAMGIYYDYPFDVAMAIAIDAFGYIYVTGQSLYISPSTHTHCTYD